MPPGRLPREVFQACPTGRRPRGRPRTRWRDYVSRLAWERLGIPRKSWRKCLGNHNGSTPLVLAKRRGVNKDAIRLLEGLEEQEVKGFNRGPHSKLETMQMADSESAMESHSLLNPNLQSSEGVLSSFRTTWQEFVEDLGFWRVLLLLVVIALLSLGIAYYVSGILPFSTSQLELVILGDPVTFPDPEKCAPDEPAELHRIGGSGSRRVAARIEGVWRPDPDYEGRVSEESPRFTFSRSVYTDTGLYQLTCGGLSAEIHLNVLFGFDASVSEGGAVRLDCHYSTSGSHVDSVRWEKDGKVVLERSLSSGKTEGSEPRASFPPWQRQRRGLVSAPGCGPAAG
ncbi:hypothetical protein L3Q82_002753 [Scortum barcoo]|uniref:Uncharacterized protein n=1 Tax=Scortum barcoo TaxID=214431 RepID=A0ACB8VUW2_9TELE|nr:hypothetical protein L3Q82_002753 [Scortum barcoo]